MKDVRITAVRRTEYPDLMALYENPLEEACTVPVGSVFISHDAEKPEGLCEGAWRSMKDYVGILARGGGDIYGNWMKYRTSAMVSCDDGFRPVSFYIETIDRGRGTVR